MGPSDIVLNLKLKLEETNGIYTECQTLFLKDKLKLIDYHIEHYSTIQLNLGAVDNNGVSFSFHVEWTQSQPSYL